GRTSGQCRADCRARERGPHHRDRLPPRNGGRGSGRPVLSRPRRLVHDAAGAGLHVDRVGGPLPPVRGGPRWPALPARPVRRPPPPPLAPTTPNALALLKALRRRWVFGLSVGLVCAAAASAAAWFLVPSSKHTA